MLVCETSSVYICSCVAQLRILQNGDVAGSENGHVPECNDPRPSIWYASAACLQVGSFTDEVPLCGLQLVHRAQKKWRPYDGLIDPWKY